MAKHTLLGHGSFICIAFPAPLFFVVVFHYKAHFVAYLLCVCTLHLLSSGLYSEFYLIQSCSVNFLGIFLFAVSSRDNHHWDRVLYVFADLISFYFSRLWLWESMAVPWLGCRLWCDSFHLFPSPQLSCIRLQLWTSWQVGAVTSAAGTGWSL